MIKEVLPLADLAPSISVELRPPRSGLDALRGMDVWIDLHHGIRRLAGQGTVVLLTDDAVGHAEEESLTHLSANLGGQAALHKVVPFLTCKHTLEYCRMFVRRAAALGVGGVTVVGGDTSVGPPRCVPHGSDLRRILREEVPGLPLGGWANPHRNPVEQAAFVADPGFSADFLLTQVMSHHSIDRVMEFKRSLEDAGSRLPVVYGVFYYRSGNPKTLDVLSRFFPVPAAELNQEFRSGASPEEVCARSIAALSAIGAEKVYVSNLHPKNAAKLLATVQEKALGS